MGQKAHQNEKAGRSHICLGITLGVIGALIVLSGFVMFTGCGSDTDTTQTEPASAEPFSSEERAYVSQLIEDVGVLVDALDTVGRLTQEWPLTSAQTTRLAKAMATICVLDDVYRDKQVPSERLVPMSREWKAGLSDYADACEHLASGIDNLDSDSIARAKVLLESGTRHIERATEAMDEVNASLPQ